MLDGLDNSQVRLPVEHAACRRPKSHLPSTVSNEAIALLPTAPSGVEEPSIDAPPMGYHGDDRCPKARPHHTGKPREFDRNSL